MADDPKAEKRLVTLRHNGPAPIARRVLGNLAGKRHQAVSIAGVTLLVFALSGLLVPRSLSGTALDAMFPVCAVLVIAAVGETLVIQQRGIDLSVPGNVALSAYLAADIGSRYHVGLVVALAVVGLVAVCIGLVNGLLVTRLGITPIIATFAMNALLIGAVTGYSGASPASVDGALASLGTGRWLGVSEMFWLAVVVAVVVGLVSTRTSWGRRFTAVGASPGAARCAGLISDRYVVSAYVLASVLYSLAGVLLVSYVSTSSTTMGDPYLLSVVAAVFIGGTPLSGGKGSALATATAALLLSQLDQVVLTLGAASAVQYLIQAFVIMAAAALESLHLTVGSLGGFGRKSRRILRRGTRRGGGSLAAGHSREARGVP